MRPKFPWAVMALALCIRGSVLWMGQASLQDDPDAYARLAVNWSESGIYGVEAERGEVVSPTAFRPPLYPWLLSWLAETADPGGGRDEQTLAENALPWTSHASSKIPVWRVACLHLLLGMATVGLTWGVARELGVAWPWLPALLVAFDPLLLRASQVVMTETLAAGLTVLAWWLWFVAFPLAESQVCGINQRQRAAARWLGLFGLGFVMGISILARPTAAPWAVLVVLGIVLFSSGCWKRRLNDGLLVCLLVLACLAPWTLRNYAALGKPIWATSHGGYTLLLANNPLIYRHFQANGPSRNWDADAFHARWATRLDQASSLSPNQEEFWLAAPAHSAVVTATPPAGQFNEVRDDQLAYAAAWETIRRNPDQFALSCLYRVGWLWAPWPNTGAWWLKWAIGSWYSVIFALTVLYGLRCLRQRPRRDGLAAWWPALALLVSLTAVHAVFWSNMRMRAPAMAVVYVAAVSYWPQSRRPNG